MKYLVIENAGYDGECVVQLFATYREAVRFVERSYDESERESLHVAIAKEVNGERTYEI